MPACNQCNNEQSRIEHHLLIVLSFGARHTAEVRTLNELESGRLQNNELTCAAIFSMHGTGNGLGRMLNEGQGTSRCHSAAVWPTPNCPSCPVALGDFKTFIIHCAEAFERLAAAEIGPSLAPSRMISTPG
ncbi:hypothetical protein HT749_30735 [Burkholderia cepacia]|uniref:hypothetical protein n=1 Tax=Burkholderia cepacia TaxID=292 RepID=UPI00157AA65A|nr:hypothetical protein [Burkholderia cepacia]NTX47767.1 hypothetical protein [Burkholderia cepacia]